MQLVTRIDEVKKLVRELRRQGKTIGLVPTMGYLHEGHLTLMRRAKAEQDVVVATVFVNPLQFGPSEDFAVYPRDLDRDSRLAAAAGVDVLFAPPVEEMYPRGYENMLAFVDVRRVTERLCGASRPGHFRGVATVVTKLFNIVEPDAAYFGQKDAQQVVVIRTMVRDLNMNVRIVTVPIVREPDGLAMSSRNVYLAPAERQAALVLSRALKLAKEKLDAGERSAATLIAAMRELISREPLATIDYISVSDAETLEELDTVRAPALVALAVKIGKTRLIDNLLWEETQHVSHAF
ncbi:pantoate--beta-alanine ligase [Sporolituus thermophilus]|uniref:Pantothenate synthetase n=1 Tax=Sporolituus thermophilus DSM 23256 TaxID=1123285 RepID=A0A1G7IXB1_9FIRM|nr:pantoate--beta-alanine ligase [Sporolituus thermophilus]SDF17293.1 pantothenate synthetase [Sporolituus thermophilus DSM 23256]